MVCYGMINNNNILIIIIIILLIIIIIIQFLSIVLFRTLLLKALGITILGLAPAATCADPFLEEDPTRGPHWLNLGWERQSCIYRDVRVQIVIWFQTFLLWTKPNFRLLMQFECHEKHIISGISDYFRLFLTDALTPLKYLVYGNTHWADWNHQLSDYKSSA